MLGLGTAGLIGVLLPSLNHSRGDGPGRMKCASNLRQIGQAVQMYANENRGAFPPDFPTLLLSQELTSGLFVCQSTDDERADGPTTAAIAAQLTAGGHLSYVYTGRGMTVHSPAGAVVAYEPLDNHRDGSNVLFADFKVKWLDAAAMKKLTGELDAGYNPPRAANGK
jgi:prepilin-type processing-associated H-X9-DG protein